MSEQTDDQAKAAEEAAEAQDTDEPVQQKAPDLPGPGQPEEDVPFNQDTEPADDET